MAEVDVQQIMREVRWRAAWRRSWRVGLPGAAAGNGAQPPAASDKASAGTGAVARLEKARLSALVDAARERAKRIEWLRQRVRALKRLANRPPRRPQDAGGPLRRALARARDAAVFCVSFPLRLWVRLQVRWALLRRQAELNAALLQTIDELTDRLERCERRLASESPARDAAPASAATAAPAGAPSADRDDMENRSDERT